MKTLNMLPVELQEKFTCLLSFLVAGLIVYITWLMVTHSNLNFDEGYNLQVPINLIQYGIYGSRTLSGFVKFDPFISSGPLFLLPVAPIIGLFGLGVVKVRLVSFFYFIILIIVIYLFNRRLLGHLAAFLALIFLFSVQNFFSRSSSLVGDGAGVSLLITGLYAWALSEEKQRLLYAVLAGLLWGAAVWAKSSMIVAVGIVITVVFLGLVLSKRRSLFRLFGVAAILALAIGAGWFILSVLNTWRTGSLLAGSASRLVEEQFNFNFLLNLRNNLPMVFKTIALAAIVTAVYNIVVLYKNRPNQFTASLAVNGLPLAWILWWLLFNRFSVDRHLFPGLIFAIIPLVQFFVSNAGNWYLRIFKLGIAILFILGAVPAISGTATYLSQLEQINTVKVDQALMAHFISKLNPDVEVMGWGWYMAWDVAALSNKPFGDLSVRASVSPSENIHLVITPTMVNAGLYETVLLPVVKKCAGALVYKAGIYELYSLIGPCTLQ